MRFHRIWFAFCVMWVATVVSAFELERVEIEGLSHNSVYAIVQDHRGFLWLGTADGLNRFDGREVVVFRNEPGNEASLAGNVVYSLAEDPDGTLWIGTSGGVARYGTIRDGLRQVFTCDGEPVENAMLLVEEDTGIIWAGSASGLWRLSVADECWLRVPILPDHGVGLVREGPDGILILGSVKGAVQFVHLFDPVSMELNEIEFPAGRPPSFAFHAAASGELWLDASGPADLAHGPRRVRFKGDDSAEIAETWAFAEQPDGVVWIGTNLGLRRWDPTRRQLETVMVVQSAGAWLPNHVRALLFDRDDALWVGTHGGLYRYDPFRKDFATLRRDPSNPNSLSGDAVSAVYEDSRGRLWIGTFGAGVNRLDPASGTIRHYHHPKAAADPLADVVWAFLPAEDGRIWVASTNGLSALDPESGVYSEYPEAYPVGLPLRALARSRDGGLWVGGLGGLCHYWPNSGRSQCFGGNPEARDLGVAAVESLLRDDGGGVWIGGRNLVRFDPEDGEFETHADIGDDGKGVGGEGIWAMHRSRAGQLWLGSGSGLTRYEPSSREFRHYSMSDGLPGSQVYSILEDARGRLWLGTNSGLALFDPAAPAGAGFRTFDASDGVRNTEFNRGACLRTRDGKLLFGGLDGVTYFDPEQLHDNPRPPQLVIKSITVSNREGPTRHNPWAISRLDLSYRDTIVSFDFVALSYSNPEKNRYAYRLEGFDDRWVDGGSRGSARYTNLAPGRYLLRVRASNSDGVWNEEGVSLPLTVAPPFWQTWWFRATGVILIAAAAWTLHRFRIKRLLELERVRLQIASDLHDDLSSNLAGVALEADMLRQSPDLTPEDQDRLGELRDTTLDMVASLRDIVWIISPEHDTVESLESRMRRTAKSLAGRHEVRFDAGGSQAVKLDMGQRRNLFLVFKEAVHNAVRHAHAERLTIRLLTTESTLRLEVEDDGNGFVEDNIVAGHGLRSMRWRAEQMGADLDINSQPGAGTVVVLEINLA